MLPEEPILETVAEDERPKQRTRWWLVVGVVILVGGIAAAFVAGRWMNDPANPGGSLMGGPRQGMRLSARSEGAGGDAVSVELKLEPAIELPHYQPTTNGIFVERKDNSLFIGTGNATITVNNETGANASFDGPKVEVVITEQTIVYRDITRPDFESQQETIQQIVELSSIEAIPPQAAVSVWGRKVDDRIIADVVFFMSPMIMKAPGGQ